MTGLSIDALTVRIPLRGKDVVHAATEVSLEVASGTVTALAGESGCGKSIVAAAVVGVLPPTARTDGAVRLDLGDRTVDLLDEENPRTGARPPRAGLGAATPAHRALRRPRRREHSYRGRHIALIPQSPGTHFTPVRTIGSQLAEAIAALGTDHTPAALVERAGLESSALSLYPHELSGGMAQRAAVAAALAGDPEVIVADEPTAGLDRARTDQIGQLLRECADQGAAVLLITHDLGHLLRAGIADTVAIMYASRLMEVGPGREVLDDPWHDYTGDLLAALPERGLRPLPHPPLALTNLSETCPYAGGPTALVREGERMIRRPRSRC
ncbi:ABC transporter ATP-binding protein [Nocardia sp. MH4]|uniref:ATP-binding cassette domain-containing protein n=1 Tax=Nocardia TaxID=1817 RepID=UPI001C4E6E8D|nr:MULTISPECIES: ATP-binding cassette domain-containing protein [Nocardia]MBW0272400.1 ABC transporter ATP-binding protein [Nocardia sp. MH4]